jgi:hypothetical protein
MADTSLSQPYGVSARYAAVITPANDTDLANVTRAVYVGTGGDLEVVMAGGGNTVVIPGVPSGALLPISVSRIRAASTTAEGIVAFW